MTDTLGVMARRWHQGRHPFSADRGHLHHRLARWLHSPRRALIILVLLAALLAGVGLLGQALAWPEALRFGLALALVSGYLWFNQRLPAWHRQRRKKLRALAVTAAAPALPAGQGDPCADD